MKQLIVYPNNSGGISVCYPAECGIPIEEVARKDVPKGLPFILVPETAVPEDHTFFAAFEADFSSPDGYGIGSQAWFIEKYESEIALINSLIFPPITEEQTQAEYDIAVSNWSAFKEERIKQLQKQIAVQQAEMNQ